MNWEKRSEMREERVFGGFASVGEINNEIKLEWGKLNSLESTATYSTMARWAGIR